ncbi:MAG: hypothetical protein IGS23_05420 [Rivularia sp. T60_A2020_040]|nr:hypothetical protein [Rivularia sp. T60_A2020_040]
MFDLPMPIELQQIAIHGYAKSGRGFICWISGIDIEKTSKYYPADECKIISDRERDRSACKSNTEHLKRLLKIYNPSIEFILLINLQSSGQNTYLYPRLVPLVK